MSYQPAAHYDRVTAAWTLLLGEDLHYGVFESPEEPLPAATARLTELMVEAAQLSGSLEVLDVGCGTGSPACFLAGSFGVRVTGITTSSTGVAAATARAAADGLSSSVSFEQRDGMDNGFPSERFDRVWVLESSHLMRHRDRVISECARVLRPGGRVALCDVIRRRPMDLAEVRRLRQPLSVLREAFGDARMEPLEEYGRLSREFGLEVDRSVDLTEATRPTFAAWRANAGRHEETVRSLLGDRGWQTFVESCSILEGFWDDGTLGYGLFSARKP
ncbi:MAG TPA: methyltransferase domain-containing protein [Solirubrobacteraceae bacterium]|nr:methyltransferase domain-containing protein [Solirubrobacteraceae bacterium]